MGLTFYERRKASLPKTKQKDIVQRSRGSDSMSVYNSTRWKKLRAKMMAKFPICSDPFLDHTHKVVASKEVHHIIPLSESHIDAYSEDNLVPLCRQCHARADSLYIIDIVAYMAINWRGGRVND